MALVGPFSSRLTNGRLSGNARGCNRHAQWTQDMEHGRSPAGQRAVGVAARSHDHLTGGPIGHRRATGLPQSRYDSKPAEPDNLHNSYFRHHNERHHGYRDNASADHQYQQLDQQFVQHNGHTHVGSGSGSPGAVEPVERPGTRAVAAPTTAHGCRRRRDVRQLSSWRFSTDASPSDAPPSDAPPSDDRRR